MSINPYHHEYPPLVPASAVPDWREPWCGPDRIGLTKYPYASFPTPRDLTPSDMVELAIDCIAKYDEVLSTLGAPPPGSRLIVVVDDEYHAFDEDGRPFTLVYQVLFKADPPPVIEHTDEYEDRLISLSARNYPIDDSGKALPSQT